MCQKYTLPSSLYNLQNVSTTQFSFYVDLFLSLKIKQLMSKLVISHITVIIDTIPIKLAICFPFFLSLKAGTCLEKRNSVSTFRQTKFQICFDSQFWYNSLYKPIYIFLIIRLIFCNLNIKIDSKYLPVFQTIQHYLPARPFFGWWYIDCNETPFPALAFDGRYIRCDICPWSSFGLLVSRTTH